MYIYILIDDKFIFFKITIKNYNNNIFLIFLKYIYIYTTRMPSIIILIVLYIYNICF